MSHSTAARVKVAGLQPAQVLVALVAVLFIAAGVAGFLRTGFGDFAGEQHSMLLGFAVNPLHNVIHLAFGVLGLLLAGSSGLARVYGWILFFAYGAVFIWGLMLTGIIATNPVTPLGNPLALNTNDNWLHLGFAAVGLLIAVLPARRKIILEEPVAVPVEERRDEPVEDEPVERVRDRDVVEPATEPVPAQQVKEPRTEPAPAQPQDDVKRHRIDH
jgi:hypothetical protein